MADKRTRVEPLGSSGGGGAGGTIDERRAVRHSLKSLHTSTLGHTTSVTVKNILFDYMQELRCKYMRIPIHWKALETSKGVYDATVLANHEDLMLRARGVKSKVLWLIEHTPQWANGSADDFVPPSNPQDMGDFAAFVARYFGPGGTFQRKNGFNDYYSYCEAIEIMNEPNLDIYWTTGPDAAQYTAILNAAYTSIKAVRKDVAVVMAGLTDNTAFISPSDFINTMYANNAKFDIANIHPFGSGKLPGDSGGMLSICNTVRTRLDANGDTGKPIWATEFGYVTGPNAAASSTARIGILHLYNSILPRVRNTIKLDRVFWAHISQTGTGADFGLVEGAGALFNRKNIYYDMRDRCNDAHPPTFDYEF